MIIDPCSVPPFMFTIFVIMIMMVMIIMMTMMIIMMMIIMMIMMNGYLIDNLRTTKTVF